MRKTLFATGTAALIALATMATTPAEASKCSVVRAHHRTPPCAHQRQAMVAPRHYATGARQAVVGRAPPVAYTRQPAMDLTEQQMVREGCRPIHDALLRQTYPDGQRRYGWANGEYNFVPKPPQNDSRLCWHNGVMAWWNPPRPKELEETPDK